MSRIAAIESSPPSSLTPEEQGVVHGEPFLETAGDDVQELLRALDRDEYASEDPHMLAKYMLPAWLGREHGASAEKDQFTAEQRARAWHVLNNTGWLRRIILPEYGLVADDAVMVGGVTQTNFYRQTEFHRAVDAQGLQAPTLKLWLGERPRQDRDGTLPLLLDPNWPKPGNDIRDNPWVRSEAATRDWNDPDRWEAAFATETEVGRATMLKLVHGGEQLLPYRISLPLADMHDPNSHLQQKLPYMEGGERKRMRARQVLDYHYRTADGLEIVAMNAEAEEREMGPPRHTTASCTTEWLERYPPAQDANVVYLTSSPHAVRTARVTRRQLVAASRDDVNLWVVAAPMIQSGRIYVDLDEERRGYRDPELPPEPSILTALGEVAAQIALDNKYHYSNN